MTLLELARAARAPQGNKAALAITEEHIELAIAWARDEVRVSDCYRVLTNKEGKNIYAHLARALREAVRRKRLIEVKP